MSNGVRIEKGTKATSGHPFFCALSGWSVFIWGQGGDAGGLLLAVAVGSNGGLGHIPFVPPRLV